MRMTSQPRHVFPTHDKAANALYIGVDGGGTRCRARLATAQGEVIGEGQAGPANIRLGLDTAFEALTEACHAAFTAAALPITDLARAHAGLGLAGLPLGSAWERIRAFPHPFAASPSQRMLT